jgi:hypothetical protein
LNGDDRELGQKLVQELASVKDENESGLRQIQTLVEERAQPDQLATFIHTRRSFLMLMTHSSLIGCLSLDTHVGILYGVISGANGERAVPFFQHMCEIIETAATDESLSVSSETLESTLVAMSNTLCELLKSQRRARFHDELPSLISSLNNTVDVVIEGAPSFTRSACYERH